MGGTAEGAGVVSALNIVACIAIGWSLCDLAWAFAWAFVPGSPTRPWWHRMLGFAPFAVLVGLAAAEARAEPATLTAARTAQVTCVQREYRTRTASAGVSATEAALVARAQAEHACALEAWSRALGAAAEVRVVTATRAPVVCETNTPASLESCPGDRPTWIDLLSHGGACALCGGGVALGAWAACGGVR